MATKTHKRKEKIYIGPKLRRHRQALGLTQERMGQELDISASYLNLIENNQRPISVPVLLRLVDIYGFDLGDLKGSGDAQLIGDISNALRDPVFEGASISRQEIDAAITHSPKLAAGFSHLYNRFREQQTKGAYEGGKAGLGAIEDQDAALYEVRHFLQNNRNYFESLDNLAEALADEMKLEEGDVRTKLTARLRDFHLIRLRLLPDDVMGELLRYFDPHNKCLNLSELLRDTAIRFQMAYQIGLLEYRSTIDGIIEASDFKATEAQNLARVTLANYFAAALLMPYSRFLNEAEEARYDMALLGNRFGTSFEQTAHRLTTLNSPERRGVPFFFLRIDRAGNMSKQYSTGKFHIANFGGTCPLWNIHECFEAPDRIHTQVLELPDETRFFSLAKVVTRGRDTYHQPAQRFALAIGCELNQARRLVYASDHNLEAPNPTLIGPNCYFCDRATCRSRAHAPLDKSLAFSERARGLSIYSFGEG